MKTETDFRIETPRRTFSNFPTEVSDYRINASQLIKENDSIKKVYKESSRNFKQYLRNFHYNSFNEKPRLYSTRSRNYEYKGNNSIYNNNIFSKSISINNYRNSSAFVSKRNYNTPKSLILKNELKNNNTKNNNITNNGNQIFNYNFINNLNNNLQTISYSNKLNEIFIPALLKISGEKQLFKDKYGRIRRFEDRVKELRHQKYIKYILGNQLYFKQAEGSVTPQLTEITNFGKGVTRKLFNSYLSTFKNYSKKLNLTLDRETDINENEILIEYRLRNEIVRLKNKKEKMLKIISELMEMKKFLLCVKNKTNNIDNFCIEDKKKILYDIERKQLIENDYTVKKNQIMKQSDSKIVRQTFVSPRKSGIISNMNLNNAQSRRKSTNTFILIQEFSVSVNAPIFKDIYDFNNHFITFNDNIKILLKNYNKCLFDIETLKTELREMNEEKEKQYLSKNKKYNNEYKMRLEKRNIEKNRYENLIITKKNILKSKNQNIENYFEIYQEKINKICKFIDENYKKYETTIIYKFEDIRDPLIDKLYFIEKNFTELLLNINKVKKEEPEKYRETIKNILNRTKQELFSKNKNEQNEEIRKKYEKIQKRFNKTYYLPLKKVKEKYPFHGKKIKNKTNPKKTNSTVNDMEFDFFQI